MAGFQDFNGKSTRRLFFQYNIPALANSQVITATLKAKMVWSASCTNRPIRVYRSGEADSATTWNNQPAWGTYQDEKSYSAGWSGCNPGGKDVVWNVKQGVAAAVAEDRPTVAFGLRSPSEVDKLTWRRFLHTTSILVEYNRAPGVPTGVTVSDGRVDKPCTGATPVELGPMVNAPVVKATVADPDGGLVNGLVKWNVGWPLPSASPTFLTSRVPSGSKVSAPLPIAKVGDNMPQGSWSFAIRPRMWAGW